MPDVFRFIWVADRSHPEQCLRPWPGICRFCPIAEGAENKIRHAPEELAIFLFKVSLITKSEGNLWGRNFEFIILMEAGMWFFLTGNIAIKLNKFTIEKLIISFLNKL